MHNHAILRTRPNPLVDAMEPLVFGRLQLEILVAAQMPHASVNNGCYMSCNRVCHFAGPAGRKPTTLLEADGDLPFPESAERNASNSTTGEAHHSWGPRCHQERSVYIPRFRDSLPKPRSELLCLIRYSVRLAFNAVGVAVDPRRIPVLDLNDPYTWRPDHHHVDLGGLLTVAGREVQIREQVPEIVARNGLQAAL